MTYSATVYRHDSATPIAMYTSFRSLRITRSIGRIGAAQMKMDKSALQFIPPLDSRIVIMRSIGFSAWVVGTYFVRGVTRSLDSSGESVTLYGYDHNSLTARRIVAYRSTTSQAQKTAAADNMMRAVARENLGASSGTGRDISSLGFSVESDFSFASSVAASFAFGNVYDVLDQISNIAYSANGERVYWDCQPVDNGWGCNFIARLNCTGVDRRYPVGINPILISPEVGNVRAVSMDEDFSDEVNYVYAGGRGEGLDREVIEVSDTYRIGASTTNRMEGFLDGRNFDTTARLTAAGRRRLTEGMPKITFYAELTENDNFRLGRDFGIGDLLTVSYEGQRSVFVRGAEIQVNADDESVRIKLEAI